MTEYRPVPDEDIDAWSRLLAYAFRPAEPYDPVESVDDLPAGATLADRRGLYDEDDDLRCTGAHHWFRLRVRGGFEEVPGLSAVSTPPRHRRQGLVRRLLAESVAEYRERECGFCVLWPFSHPFYHQFGWGTCSRRATVTCTPDALAGIGPTDADPPHEFVTCAADEWEALDHVYRATNAQGLAMDRTEAWWRTRVFEGWDSDPYVAGVERGGDLVGYLVYDITEGGTVDAGRRMEVGEYGHVDVAAYRALVEFCRYHDSQVDEIELRGPVDTVLQDLARDPREVNLAVEPGPMIRIVDVARALSTLSYPADVEADLVFAVTDGLVGWNDRRFRLSVADGTATCEATDPGTGVEPDVTTPIAALSQVAIGFLSPERARQVGGFEIGSADAEERLTAAFPPEETFLREGF